MSDEEAKAGESTAGSDDTKEKSSDDEWKQKVAEEKAKLDELRGEGESRSQFLLRYTISHPGMSTTIVGTKNMDHFSENLAAVEFGPLPGDVVRMRRHDSMALERVPSTPDKSKIVRSVFDTRGDFA